MAKVDPSQSQAVGIYSPSQDLFAPKKPGGRIPGTSGNISNVSFGEAANRARRANEERYAQGLGLWDEIIQRYQPGGGFGAGAIASYERSKTRALGAGMQQLVSSGLANTTVAATIGKKYEEEVGTPFKLQLQDVQSQRLSEAQTGKAGFVERRTDQGPDPGLVARLGQQVGQAQGIQAGGLGSGLVRNQPFPESAGIAAQFARQISRGGSGSTSYQGANYQATRGGQEPGMGTYNPAGLNMEQLYGSPTYGEPGGPAGPPAPEGYSPVVGAQPNDPTEGGKYPHRAPVNGIPWASPGSPGRMAWVQAYDKQQKAKQKSISGSSVGTTAARPGSWTRLSGAGGAGGGRF